MLAVDLVIDLGHILVIVLIGGNVVGDLTAPVGKHTSRRHTLSKLVGDLERRCWNSVGFTMLGANPPVPKGGGNGVGRTHTADSNVRKSPFNMSGVGKKMMLLFGLARCVVPWKPPKKNSLFFLMAPPMVPPKLWRL